MRPTLRRMALSVAATAVATFGVLSIAFYRPSGVTDRSLALKSLKRALAALDDEHLDTSARVLAYRDGLAESGAFLRQALRTNPTDTASIERLATVRWESGALSGTPDSDSIFSLVNIAAARAPRVPEIQADLGALLYRMGSPAEAAPFMRHAVELSPTTTRRVVGLMQDAGLEPEAIANALPQSVGVLVLLREGFERSGHLAEWLVDAEVLLPQYPGELLWAYTDACLATNAEARLLAHTQSLGVLTAKRDEAARQLAIGRTQLALKAWGLASSAAARARALSGADARVLEFAGQLAFAADNPSEAETSFREALGALALDGGRGIDRARLYRQHGQTLERLGRVDDAFDEYRRAVELLPDDPWLRQRFAASSPIPPPNARP